MLLLAKELLHEAKHPVQHIAQQRMKAAKVENAARPEQVLSRSGLSSHDGLLRRLEIGNKRFRSLRKHSIPACMLLEQITISLFRVLVTMLDCELRTDLAAQSMLYACGACSAPSLARAAL